MGFQYSVPSIVTITGAVTTEPSIPEPNTYQALKHDHIVLNGANQNIYTVTAGKTFYLMAVVFSSAGAASQCRVFEADGATDVLLLMAAANNSMIVNGSCPLHAYAATTNVVVNGGAGKEVSIWGYEV